MGDVTPHPHATGGPQLRAPESLSEDHDLAAFACGNTDLDNWLRQRARAVEGLTARTFVVAQGQRVIGYYCLAAGSVVRRDLPRKIRHNTPDSVPILVVGRLAVDKKFQRRGFGKGLLKDALLRALSASESIGVRAIIVHAIDEGASEFYKRFGFVESKLNARTFVLPIETLKAEL